MDDEVIRGKRLKNMPYDGWSGLTQEQIDDVLKPFIVNAKKHPSQFLNFITGEKLPLWQRICVDEVYPMIDKIKEKIHIGR